MLEKKFTNVELGFELTSYIDNKQNIWFLGKDVAKVLGYSDTDKLLGDMLMRRINIKVPPKRRGVCNSLFS